MKDSSVLFNEFGRSIESVGMVLKKKKVIFSNNLYSEVADWLNVKSFDEIRNEYSKYTIDA